MNLCKKSHEFISNVVLHGHFNSSLLIHVCLAHYNKPWNQSTSTFNLNLKFIHVNLWSWLIASHFLPPVTRGPLRDFVCCYRRFPVWVDVTVFIALDCRIKFNMKLRWQYCAQFRGYRTYIFNKTVRRQCFALFVLNVSTLYMTLGGFKFWVDSCVGVGVRVGVSVQW